VLADLQLLLRHIFADLRLLLWLVLLQMFAVLLQRLVELLLLRLILDELLLMGLSLASPNLFSGCWLSCGFFLSILLLMQSKSSCI
jgi:hypothetical protein